MDNVRVEVSGEVSSWLCKLRKQAGLSVSDAAKLAQVEEVSILNWETGFPIPVPDFLILIHCYGVRPASAEAKMSALLRRVSILVIQANSGQR